MSSPKTSQPLTSQQHTVGTLVSFNLLLLKGVKKESPAAAGLFPLSSEAGPEVQPQVVRFEYFAHFLTGEGGPPMHHATQSKIVAVPPLTNKRILITRTRHQASDLAAQLENRRSRRGLCRIPSLLTTGMRRAMHG